MISVRMLRDVWAFRGFILASVKREFRARYLGTQFGFLWAIIQPLAMITVYTLVFARLMKPSLPGYNIPFAYSIYLCAGILTWGFFAELLNRSIGVFVQNADLLKKVSLPKLSLPLIVVLSSLMNFVIVMGLFSGFLALNNTFPGWSMAAVIPVIIILIAFTTGLGVLLGTINVFYRDIEQTIGVALQFWFWLTPIVYVTKTLPGALESVLQWNPIWPIIRAMHTIFLEARSPDWSDLLYPAGLAVGLLYLGLFAFWRLNGEIVDEL